ncbi:MAG TPA: LPS export ABC transporter periplasmic protein LptC [Desulfuromonadales bacterium]|nr:LPS export ABC transporter periplasmic protein LptC [Desulfuromonadales bacterium]
MRPLLALLALAAIIAIAAVVIRNGSPESKPVPSIVQQLPQNIDIALNKARFSEIQESLLVWELVAERAEYDKTGDMAYLKDIRMEFQKTPSQGAITVTADSGEYFFAKKDILLKGNVLVVTDKDARFDTEQIAYIGALDQFTTKAPVLFRQQRIQLSATGMDFGVKSQKANFKSLVVASIVMK